MALVPGLASAQTAPESRGTAAVCDGSYESNFDDIAGSVHRDNIRCMADDGLTEGLRGGTSYGPRLDVNRGQMASFVARFIEDYNDEDLPAGTATRFNDVPGSYVHASNINKLAAIGVVEGTNASGGQSYAPNAGVTRAQMGSFIRRALSYLDNGQVTPLSAPPAATANYFPDVAGSVHQANINAIASVGIVQGFNDGTYRPNDLVKRDQMASFIMRAYDYAVTEDLGAVDVTDPLSVSFVAQAATVVAGENIVVDVSGDTDRISSITAAGACIADGTVTLGDDDTITVATDAASTGGMCTVTFTVTFDDGTTQMGTVDVTVTPATVDPETGTITGTVTEEAFASPLTFTATAENAYMDLGNERIEWESCPDGEGSDCVVFVGTVGADGTVTVNDATFPEVSTTADTPLGPQPVVVIVTVDEPFGGTFDSETGRMALDGVLDVNLNVANGLAVCDIEGVAVSPSTDGENGSAFDGQRATLFDGNYAVPASAGADTCGIANSVLGLPSASGENAMLLDLFFEIETGEPVAVEGDPIEGATVAVEGTELSATTAVDGTYTIENAPAGTHTLIASAEGFESETREGVVVVAGETTVADFVLSMADVVTDFDDVRLSWQNELVTGDPAGSEPTVFSQGQPNADGVANISVNETDNSITYTLDYSQVDGPFAAAPGFHVHEGGLDVNGPVVVTLATPDELEAAASGEGDQILTRTVAVDEADFDVSDIVDDPSGYYLNLHSNDFPAGAIRGQLPAGGQDLIDFETITVSADDSEAANVEGGTVSFTSTGLNDDLVYRLTLVDADAVSLDDDGELVFDAAVMGATSGGMTAVPGDRGDNVITAVNGEAQTAPAATFGAVEPDNGQITLDVMLGAPEDGFHVFVYHDNGVAPFEGNTLLDVEGTEADGFAPIETYGYSFPATAAGAR